MQYLIIFLAWFLLGYIVIGVISITKGISELSTEEASFIFLLFFPTTMIIFAYTLIKALINKIKEKSK